MRPSFTARCAPRCWSSWRTVSTSPQPVLTIEVCAEALTVRQVEAETIAALRDLLTRCDFARFAPAGGPPTDREAARRLAGEVIAGLEKWI